MRLRQRDLKTVYVKPHIPSEDDEGDKTEVYGASYSVQATTQPLGGQIKATEYGETLKYMIEMKTEELGNIKENDGVCVYVGADSEPDYRIVSIKPYSIPVLELEKRNV
jgi:hypothetical protein